MRKSEEKNKMAIIGDVNSLVVYLKVHAITEVVLIGGCFDILHFGHLTFLQKAKQEGNFLVVLLESDEFIKLRKKRSPVHTQAERTAILASLRQVDWVIPLSRIIEDADYRQIVKTISPAVIAVTSGDPLMAKKQSQAKMFKAQIRVVTPLIKTLSSTKIASDTFPQ